MMPGATRCASLLLAAVTLMGGRAAAQSTCESPIGISPAKRWSPPLDRLITINTAQLTLREALDRLAAAGNVRLSYSSQLLTLGANVCIGFNSTTLGDALAAVLRGAAVEPISGGSDQIVLAPIRQRVAAPESLSAIEPVFALPHRGRDRPACRTCAVASANRSECRGRRSAGCAIERLGNAGIERHGARVVGLECQPDQPAHALRQHARRIVVRTQLAQDLHRRHRGREPAACCHGSRPTRSNASR